jgi:uncharacterized protein (UPF0332 family)
MSIMSPQGLILKANRAIESAQLLRNAGDIDGACNRAHDIRQVADYTGDLIEVDQLDSLITQASDFVEWINSQVISVPN